MLSFARPGPWALFLLVLIVVLNGCGLFIYRASHPGQSLSLQLWSYLESETFRLVTGSLVLPLLVFLVEGRFNIAETIRKGREERAQKVQNDRQQWRLEAVERSAAMLNDLFALATEVVYWQPENDLNNLLARARNFFDQAGDAVASWPVRFPSLYESVDVGTVLLPLFNTFYVCITSVAVHLGEMDDRQEQAELQATLGVIQEGIMSAWRNPGIGILRCGLELEMLRDSHRLGGADEADAAAEEPRILAEIEQYMEPLRSWVLAIAERDATAEPMSNLAGAEAGAFREVYASAREWLLEQPGRSLSAYGDFDTFQQRFEAIPHSQLMRAYQVGYSKEWLRDLSDWLALETYCAELQARTTLPA
ncbi:MAG: hypothetical protein ACRDQE_08840 [Gaiellales bacterium]